jgi:hypothetical protein
LKRLENFCVRGFAASPQLYPVGPDWFNYRLVYGYFVFKGRKVSYVGKGSFVSRVSSSKYTSA